MNKFINIYPCIHELKLLDWEEKGFKIVYDSTQSSYIIETVKGKLTEYEASVVAINEGLVIQGKKVLDYPDKEIEVWGLTSKEILDLKDNPIEIPKRVVEKLKVDKDKVIKSEPITIREGSSKPIEDSKVGVKFDGEKNKMELLPPFALEKIAEIFTFGAKKYNSWNWSKGIEYSRLYGAMQRHLSSWYKGEESDLESGKSHLYHAGCCLLMLIEMEEFRKDLDNRPKHYKNEK